MVPTTSFDYDLITQNTAWFERQLFDTQLVAEFEFDRLGRNDAAGQEPAKHVGLVLPERACECSGRLGVIWVRPQIRC